MLLFVFFRGYFHDSNPYGFLSYKCHLLGEKCKVYSITTRLQSTDKSFSIYGCPLCSHTTVLHLARPKQCCHQNSFRLASYINLMWIWILSPFFFNTHPCEVEMVSLWSIRATNPTLFISFVAILCFALPNLWGSFVICTSTMPMCCHGPFKFCLMAFIKIIHVKFHMYKITIFLILSHLFLNSLQAIFCDRRICTNHSAIWFREKSKAKHLTRRANLN